MRPISFGVVATLVFASPVLVTGAAAQQKHGGGGPAPAAPHVSAPAAAPHVAAPAPHIAAPAPHIAAPAPHIAAPAPHVAAPAPHVAAPAAPHVASPRFAAPRAAPHVASPHTASPRVTSPNAASHAVERRHGGPSFAGRPVERGANRHAVAPAATPRAGAAVGNATNGLGGRANERHAGPNAGNAENNGIRGRTNAPSTVGQGPAGPGRNAVQGARQNGRGNRVLSNPVLANQSARDPAARSLARSTFQGRFAQSGWARDFDRDRHHHRHFGFVLGFVGPVFWPYAYDDFVDYTYWPAAYDTFWPYAYDDVYEGMFGGYASDYGASYSEGGAAGSSSRRHGRVAARGPAGGETGPAPLVCSGDAQGLTDLPVQKIADQVQPDRNQQALLDQLKAATGKAVQIMQAACPTDLPATPTGRLAAMRTRIQAMVEAVQTVRPALEKFYASLSDEQKERFNALDQEQETASAATTGSGTHGQQDISQACDRRASSVAGMPIDRIRSSLRLNDAQNAALQRLEQASAKASDTLKSNCSAGQALTPPGRMAAMEQRLQAMLQAIDTVQPALQQFYAALSDEQKARFDRLGARPA